MIVNLAAVQDPIDIHVSPIRQQYLVDGFDKYLIRNERTLCVIHWKFIEFHLVDILVQSYKRLGIA